MKKLILLVAMLAMALICAVPSLAQSTVSGDQGANPLGGDGGSVRGIITDLSGSVVLVEADPSANSGPKGYFTVTGETEIARLEDDRRVVASFEDLAVGHQVQTAYAGLIAESYPPQGSAESIVILNHRGRRDE